MTDFAAARRHMVDGQIRTFDVTDLRVLTAMDEVPREAFLSPALAGIAYLDMAAPVGDGPRRLLKPMVFARLLQGAEIAETDHVLYVGCASGYGAAILARIASQVVALEEDPSLVKAATAALAGKSNITVVSGPLKEGWSSGAPYDVIVLEGAAEVVPPALFKQLADGGRLACVLGSGPASKATIYCRSGDDIGARPLFEAVAGVLPGLAKPLEFAF